MIFTDSLETYSDARLRIAQAYRKDEAACLEVLLDYAELSDIENAAIAECARDLITTVREKRRFRGGVDSFMAEYDLSTDEGIALMCLAEALLRIPDKDTIDQLIRDKLTGVNWQSHLKNTDSFTVNAATWALMFTGKVLHPSEHADYERSLANTLRKLVSRSGEPIIRAAVAQAMKILSKQFVMGRNIQEALQRAKANERKGYRYSYDMLGEAAHTEADAERYYQAYLKAIDAVGEASEALDSFNSPGISVKLSALHPRYEVAQMERVKAELIPKVFSLARAAKLANIGLTIDAEEAVRLDLSLDIIESVFTDPSLDGWEGFGLALQSYQKRAFYIIDWLVELSNKCKRRLNVRLIKGAYWDSEIKHTQQNGLSGYPVFTRKYSTDVSFLACARKILQFPEQIYPQFATHNAYSVATILTLVDDDTEYEFQCLHGMGQALYEQIVGDYKVPCRVYAPVGSHEDLLPYLVRRLLENGANSSFVNRLADDAAPIETLLVDPVDAVRHYNEKPHPKIPLPTDLFGEFRDNSHGFDLSDTTALIVLQDQLRDVATRQWQVAPIINGQEAFSEGDAVVSPSHIEQTIGRVQTANQDDIERALQAAQQGYITWDKTSVKQRAACLDKVADLYEQHFAEFIYLAMFEAGKTLDDAVNEVREAVDFCHYYAAIAQHQLAESKIMQGYTGEYNHLEYHGRGPMLCISPWNFPLAIFTGQVAACLAAGNSVIAKPAEQTPLIAGLAVRLFLEAGIPATALSLLPGDGATVGGALTADSRIAGVVFTGSTDTAKVINRTLAQRDGAIVPLVAETGGQNAMIVDSSALLEQVVVDVITSAFKSAGQRCSALRVLYIQEDVADRFIEMLKGAMAELTLGDPSLLKTDIGPVIDQDAKAILEEHFTEMLENAELIYQLGVPDECRLGTFFAPCVFEVENIQQISQEFFGPFLHLIRYASKDLNKVIDDINGTGFGLTFGIHSRIEHKVQAIQSRIHAGNCYVNRNMIGAAVGIQPFGGEGLSGTGPKAGGPNYLKRLCIERTVTIDTTAAGGNASLMSLD